jgi:phage recombination protein Bet
MSQRRASHIHRANRFKTHDKSSKAPTESKRGEDAAKQGNPLSLLDRSVLRSGLSYDSFVRHIVRSALGRLSIWDQGDLDRLLMLAERLGLDPLSHEIYAMEVMPESGKKSRIVFVVGVDGWSKIINAHPQFDGMRFVESAPSDDQLPQYFECTIFRKDRRVATTVREYMHEAHTNQGAWLTHPRRMLRHKSMVQCARVCFGLSGIFDPDEALRIALANSNDKTNPRVNANTCTQEALAKDSMNELAAKGEPSHSIRGSEIVKAWVKKNRS